jgi:ribosomal protein L40E
MECPKCQHENREDAQFCMQCGEKLALKCFECGKILPLSAEYCDRCGHGALFASKKTVAASEREEETEVVKDDSPLEAPAPKPEVEISPRTRIFLYVAILYAIILTFLAVSLVSPGSSVARAASLFGSLWANFIFLGLCFVVAAFLVYGGVYFCCKGLLRTKWVQPKLGKMLVSDGYITKEQLKEALAEQEQKIGEVLLQAGRVSAQQLDEALNQQKKMRARLGDLLIAMGFATEEDINWALGKVHRRLGEILQDKGLLAEHDLDWVLGEQQFGSRRI